MPDDGILFPWTHEASMTLKPHQDGLQADDALNSSSLDGCL